MSPYRRAPEAEAPSPSPSSPLYNKVFGVGLTLILAGTACVVFPIASVLPPMGAVFVIAGVFMRDRAEDHLFF